MNINWCCYNSDCESGTKAYSTLQLFFCYSDAHESVWKHAPEKLKN